jgi:hypothetical protein
MAMNWKEWQGEPRNGKRDEVYASLGPDGNLTFNKKTYEELGEPAHVVLLVDKGKSSIGIRAGAPEKRNARRVRKSSRGSTRLVHCSRFLRELGIKLEQTVCFPTARIEDKALVLELKYKVPVACPRRKPAPDQTT